MSAAPSRSKMLWITWEKQLRNRSMSSALGAPLCEVFSSHGRIIRYMACISRTVVLLLRERPAIVICQNPSVVLTFFLLKIRHFLGFRVAIDAHYGGIEAYNGSNTFQRVLDHCNRSADLVIVTNKNHAERIRRLGGREFVCSDPLPDLSRYRFQGADVARKVFFICSFDVDEPYTEVFRAAEMLAPEGFRFYVSGNYRKGGISPADFAHVKLLGFVPEAEFYHHLFTSQVVIDLTDNENCLVCGAYEALEAGKPLVLSKKKALLEFFTGGTVFTENQATAIASAVRCAYADRSRLATECGQWVSLARAEMRERISNLGRILENL